jgi:hypothetical protein
MLKIKHGQAEISEYIKSDISDITVKTALNSGKRLRALVCLGCRGSIEMATAVEYLHNGLLLLEDMEMDRATRRGTEAIHRKFGWATASKISAYLISKGLTGASDEVSKRVSLMINASRLKHKSGGVPLRVLNLNLKQSPGGGGIFAIAFMLSVGPSAAIIGECLGVCYYLGFKSEDILINDKIDLFTENMREVVSELTKQNLWSPLLKEIVNFIMLRFKDSNNIK